MFHSARLKLTAWYLLIITIITGFFSLAMYRVLTSELDRVERMQRVRFERISPRPSYLDHELIVETKNRIKMILLLIDMGIISASAAAAYFLAGRTLQPIKVMVDEQNRFISDASHELRTPLTSLKSEIEVGLRDKSLDLNQANNLQILSDGLIKLSQYQKSQNNFILSSVSLSQAIDEAVKKVAGQAKIKRASFDLPVSDINLQAERQSLVELLVILLDNAVKYSPSDSQVSVGTKADEKMVQITVTDQGMGIGPKDLPHIFDRFYRTDKSRTKSEVTGYGLGLSIAKQIADRHHGTIKVKSVLNKGTTFTISLPRNS